jgi:hypothetical protein
MQISQYIDAVELFWNSYIIVYDTGSQLQLFRSAQEGVQSMQAAMRAKSDKWVVEGQDVSDRFAKYIGRLIGSAWFWIAAGVVTLAGFAIKHGHALKMQLEIWRLRQGRGVINEAVVEELFYRAARLAQHRAPKRRPGQTWREWIFGLPDPNRKSILARALAVFEKSKYGRVPASNADFALLEETIRELKL